MTKRILIICAQVSEAQATIRRLNAQPVEGEVASIWSEGSVSCLYHFERGSIAICNVGCHAAQMTVATYGRQYDEIWNLGLAGSLHDHYPVGEFLSIQMVGKYVPLEKESLDPRSWECLTTTLPHFSFPTNHHKIGKLITSEFPIHDPLHRKRLSSEWDLVDMEGYGIAYAASHFNLKCQLWKIVSDFAAPGGRELIRKHKAELSEKIADRVLDLLKP